MAERTIRLRLGLFMGASLVALAGLVVLFGAAPRLFSRDARYTVLYPEAPGIAPGTPVRKSGVRIGEVTDIELDPATSQVRVRIAVDRKYLPRKNEEPTITRGLLSGDTALDFLPALGLDGNPVPRGDDWPPGSEIPGVPPVTPRSLLNSATTGITSAQQSLDRLAGSFERLEAIAPRIERTADEATEMFKDVRAFIPELRETNKRLQGLIGPAGPLPEAPPADQVVFGPRVRHAAIPPIVGQQLRAEEPNMKALIRDAQALLQALRPLAEDVRASFGRLEPELRAAITGARVAVEAVNELLSPENRKLFTEALKNLNNAAAGVVKFSLALNDTLALVDKTLQNVDGRITDAGAVLNDVRAVTKPLAANADDLVKSIYGSASELNKTLAEFRTVLALVTKQDGTVQKLLSDPTLYYNLDDAAASLARVMGRAEKITRDLEVFADKVARRPELIGLGGMVRPSSGLKEAPGGTYRPDWPPASSARPPQRTQYEPYPPPKPTWEPPRPPGAPPPVQGYPP